MPRLFFVVLLFLSVNLFAQSDSKTALYHVNADGMQQIDSAIEAAQAKNKHVLIQVGGNWCSWCIKLHAFIEDHPAVDSILHSDYIVIRVNYSKESKSMEVMERLDFPNRFGFPVLVILNKQGERIHTQNTAYLEEGKSYSEKKLNEFLVSWNTKAIDPDSYKK